MGSLPATTAPHILWERIRPGDYRASADGVGYHAHALGPDSWELSSTAYALVRWTPSYRIARILARLTHRETAAWRRRIAATRGHHPMEAVLTQRILDACALPDASLMITSTPGGYRVTFAAHPAGDDWLHLTAQRDTPAEAMRRIDAALGVCPQISDTPRRAHANCVLTHRILAVCALPNASLVISGEPDGWLMLYAARPREHWVRHRVLADTPDRAVAELREAITTATTPGGDLFTALHAATA